ncbi:hypothetical protein [Brevundimonas sp.]|uniref:hypothetical protein n=1 Tax=Brevundimonas sp. TaxID=1871086 RepID=UPI002D544D2F|nr:hypothetical protein [Brevundimonas sp.]HYC75237.1 hypothetical protein [Brevundimonas sp.]
MIAVRALLALAAVAIGSPALAQTPPAYVAPGASVDPHRHQADQHRYEIDRLRAQADQRAAFARQLELEARLRRMEVEAARQPPLTEDPTGRALRSPEEERALREAATERRRATTAGVTQIDRWLDRPAR